MYCLLDIADIADIADHDIAEVARALLRAGRASRNRLAAHRGLGLRRAAIAGIRWRGSALRDDSTARCGTHDGGSGRRRAGGVAAEKIDEWESTNSSRLGRRGQLSPRSSRLGRWTWARRSVRQVRNMVPDSMELSFDREEVVTRAVCPPIGRQGPARAKDFTPLWMCGGRTWMSSNTSTTREW